MSAIFDRAALIGDRPGGVDGEAGGLLDQLRRDRLPLEQALEGKPVTAEAIERAAELALGVAKPISDQRGSADYRRHLVRVLTRRTLRTALARAGG